MVINEFKDYLIRTGQTNPEWAEWIKDIPNNPYIARFRLGKKTFSWSNMGRQALTSHEEGKKHLKKIVSN